MCAFLLVVEDVNIHRTPSGWKTAVYSKPTLTDTIIPYTSNDSPKHKYAAIRFLCNRLHTYNLQPTEYLQEENTIHNILYNNEFQIKPHKPHQPKPQKQRQNTHMQTHKWITFTYTGKETTYITNLFKRSNIKIVFCTNNTIYSQLTQKHHIIDKCTQSGVCKLTCPDCNKAYVGQSH
jgi:Pyruvate/2-oxoacid:ferredoxin oxidoreductase delta subunit